MVCYKSYLGITLLSFVQATHIDGCRPGFFATIDGCRDTCPVGQVFMPTPNNPFYHCVNNCAAGYFLSSDAKSCVERCAPKQVLISNARCADFCPKNKWIQPSNSGDDSDYICVNSCSSGFGEDLDKKMCILNCPKGELFVNKPGQPHCVAKCPIDFPFISWNGLQCVKNCNPDIISSDGRHCIKACPAGELEFQKKCVHSCPVNTFTSAEGGKCLDACLIAEGLLESANGQSCVNACPANEFLSSDLSTCVYACGDNELISSNGLRCVTQCGADEIISSDQRSCIEVCPSGEYLSSDKSKCIHTCPADQVVSSDQLECKTECPVDEFLSSDLKSCEKICPDTEFISSTKTACLHTCPDTQLINIKNTHCVEKCEADEFISSDTLSCTKRCKVGEFYSADGKSCCTRCGPNEWVSVDGIRCIHLCPIGSFGVGYGKYARTCQLCATGTYSDVPGSLECDHCPAGLTTSGYGADSLTDCFCPNVPLLKKYSSKDDCDQDGVADNCDNCKYVPNPKQEDFNKNRIGDVCEKKSYYKSKSKSYSKSYSKYTMSLLQDNKYYTMPLMALIFVGMIIVFVKASTKDHGDSDSSQLYAPLTPY